MPFSDRLKLAWELKQTVFGREFHTLITLHTQKFLPTRSLLPFQLRSFLYLYADGWTKILRYVIISIHYFCNLSNLDGRVYVYVCIWLGLELGLVLGLGFGLGLVLGFGLGLGFAMICSGHGHLCLTGCGNSGPIISAQLGAGCSLHFYYRIRNGIPLSQTAVILRPVSVSVLAE